MEIPMPGQPQDPKRETDKQKARRQEKEHLSDLLDEGLEESFPASDTPAVVRPGHGIPTERNDKD